MKIKLSDLEVRDGLTKGGAVIFAVRTAGDELALLADDGDLMAGSGEPGGGLLAGHWGDPHVS